MKFLKYTGLYLAILAIGDNVLKWQKQTKHGLQFSMEERFFGIWRVCGKKILDKLLPL